MIRAADKDILVSREGAELDAVCRVEGVGMRQRVGCRDIRQSSNELRTSHDEKSE